MEKCVIYARVSTQIQDDKSQIFDLKRFASANKFKVVKVFGEKVSGYDLNAERLAYEKMKIFVLENNINLILVWELSRLGRSAIRSQNEIEFFRQNGVNIYIKHTNTFTLSDNPMDKMYVGMLSYIAEMERNTIVERSIRGRVNAAVQGKRTGFGRMPFGFMADKKGYLQIEPNESKWVVQMYQWIVEGESIKGVTTKLNSLNVQSRHKTEGRKRTLPNGKEVEIVWRSNSVSKILKNPLYKGERIYSGEKIVVPSIVHIELWDAVQKKLTNNTGYIVTTKHNYLLKGKVYCGSCGLYYQTRTERRYVSLTSFYFCSGRKDKGVNCKNGQFKSTLLDKVVYRHLFSHTDLFHS